ncbi:MAG: alpha-L-fucosidase, partial [Armatimonadetes bacterium]|nr:alpha-L-fucosidase [Armatimonadota bacterium]
MPSSTDWFRDAGWGLFFHYLASPASHQQPSPLTAEEWNAQIDAFDVPGFARKMADLGASYIFFTLGQNSGHYCSPNATYDALTAIQPGKLSRRDLVAEIADALAPHGIRLLVYLPSHAPAMDRDAVYALGCTPPWDPTRWSYKKEYTDPAMDERVAEFQRKWEAVIREWSDRWGDRVHGWWIDGCYYADRMYRHPDPPNFESFAAAMKVGNPESIVAFNPGIVGGRVKPHTEHEDYTAGEVSDSFPVCPGPTVDGKQWHVLSYLGETWGREEPRFSLEGVATGADEF